MTSPDAAAVTFQHGPGEDGTGPAAVLEAWIWSLAGGSPRVTFGGLPPRGSRAWRIAVWQAIAREAERRAAEEQAGHPLPPWPPA